MFFRRQRFHRRIALIALFGLLFQQLAMAAYACPLERGDAAAIVAAATTPPCHAPATADKGRCHQHCHPLAQTSDHAPAPAVPPALLPPTTWSREFKSARLVAPGPFACDVDARKTAPPLTIRHCSFQI